VIHFLRKDLLRSFLKDIWCFFYIGFFFDPGDGKSPMLVRTPPRLAVLGSSFSARLFPPGTLRYLTRTSYNFSFFLFSQRTRLSLTLAGSSPFANTSPEESLSLRRSNYHPEMWDALSRLMDDGVYVFFRSQFVYVSCFLCFFWAEATVSFADDPVPLF